MGRKAKVVQQEEVEDEEYEYEEEPVKPKKNKKTKKVVPVPDEEEDEEEEEEYEEEEYDEDDEYEDEPKKKGKRKKDTIDFDTYELPTFVKKEDMIMFLATYKISHIKETFDNLKEALVKIPMKITRKEENFVPTEKKLYSGGIVINACDATGSVIKQCIYSNAFMEYYVDPNLTDKEDNPCNDHNICVDAKQFVTYVKQIKNKEILIWYIDKNSKDVLTFLMHDPYKNTTSTRTIKLKNVESTPPRIQAPEIECRITMPTTDFQRYIKESAISTQDIKVSFIDTEEMPNVTKLSDPNGSASFVCNKDSVGYSVLKTKPTGTIIENVYKLKLLSMFKSHTHCKFVDIILNTNHPLIVTYHVEEFGYTILIINTKKDPKDLLIDDNNNFDNKTNLDNYKKTETLTKKNCNKVVDAEEDDEDDGEEEEEDDEEYEEGEVGS